MKIVSPRLWVDNLALLVRTGLKVREQVKEDSTSIHILLKVPALAIGFAGS